VGEDPDLRRVVLGDLVVVEDLAHYLRMSRAGVRALLRRGAIPGAKLGRRWVVDRRALLRAVAPSDARVRIRALFADAGDGAGEGRGE